MKRILSILFLAVSVSLAEADTFYLSKPLSVVSDSGITGYPVNTEIDFSGGKSSIGGKEIIIPIEFLSKTPVQVVYAPVILNVAPDHTKELEKRIEEAKAMEDAARRINAQAAKTAPKVSGALGSAKLGEKVVSRESKSGH